MYRKNSGKYQHLLDYYDNCVDENVYMDIYKSLRIVYKNFFASGLDTFQNPSQEETVLKSVRDTHGLGRVWGFVKSIIDSIDVWRGSDRGDVATTKACEDIAESLETAVDTLLVILPAYVPWKAFANIPENQSIVDMLQERGNRYRIINNPKFYAYDRAVDTICKTSIIVSTQNCKYLYGIGPQLSIHIKNHFKVQKEIPTNEEKQQTSVGKTAPACRNLLNTPVVEWLWSNSSGKTLSAYHRAAKAIARKHMHVPIQEMEKVKGVGQLIYQRLVNEFGSVN